MKCFILSQAFLGRIAAILLLITTCATVAQGDLTSAGTFQGNVGLSVDAVGSNFNPVGQVTADIPVGANVLQAYLYAAGTPFPYYAQSPDTLAEYNGAGISLAGVPINNFSKLVGAISDRPDIGRWFTGRADVTSVVRTLVAANPLAASHNWTYAEGAALNQYIDGGVLAVVFEHASLPDGTVALLDGGQRTGGETSIFSFVNPLGDPTAPGFFMDMSLAISFSCCGQVSQVDINGQRLSSAAGDPDDGLIVADGALITAGGIGDSNSNPANPFSTDPAVDDELYDLKSFLTQGDQAFSITTRNATNDDNIFFMTVHTSADIEFIPEPSSIAIALLAATVALGAVRRRPGRN